MNKDEIVKNLINGKVVAIKTDTVYGLICNANDTSAVNKIYEIKNRESKKPLLLFIKNIDEVYKYIDNDNITPYILSLMKKYWPGALTIILNKNKDVLKDFNDGKDSIGLRIPNDKLLLDVLSSIDFPLAETSCNITGEVPYKNYSEIYEKLGNKVDLIIDGGEVINNKPSTIIDYRSKELVILRVGDINFDDK